MKIEQSVTPLSPVINKPQGAGKTTSPATGAVPMYGDSVELSSQAKKMMKRSAAPASAPASASASTQTTSQTTQQATLLAAAKNMVFSNPTRASSQLEMIIAQYPNSAEAEQARQLLAQISQ